MSTWNHNGKGDPGSRSARRNNGRQTDPMGVNRTGRSDRFDARGWRRIGEKLFVWACLAAVFIPLLMLACLLGDVIIDGIGRLSWGFLTSPPSRRAGSAGILTAMVGSLYLVGLTAALALPLGVGAAIYLEEYGRRGRLSSFIETNISNLAGVPSVIYGLLGLGIFVRALGMGRSLAAGACTLALLVLPIVIMASREALRTVPYALREASYALGVTRWRTIRSVVLPMALPGILTGAILSISRAMGETAPLIVVGALAYISFLPRGLDSPYSALPIQIFNWVSRPQQEFLDNAAAGIVVLMAVLLALNAVAILLRNRYQRRLD
ncbi:MAG: phosphate ABC transporter permease PstA [Bradymonadales bacterium]|nr:phosphate ABC transporter permease PstA [Bradymonadales bacterium]